MTKTLRWTFLGVISLGLLIISLDNSILYTALPTLREDLHTTELQGLWIINAYPLVLASLLLGTGTLGDKIGHRRMFEVGLIIFGIASLAAAFAPTANYLIAARAVLGAGAATMMPATLALLRSTFTNVQERNTAIGIWGSVATIGAASGPVIGGFLLEHFHWGSVFLINIPVVIIAWTSTQFLAPKNVSNFSKHWDFISSLYAALAMTGLVLTIKELVHQPISTTVLIAGIILLLTGALLFIHRQSILTEPLLTFDIFRNRTFLAGVIAACLSMIVLSGSELVTTQRFQEAAAFSPLQAGLITGMMAVAAFPASVIGGANLHRWGFRPLISGGFITMALGFAGAAFSLTHFPLPVFVASAMTAGFGSGLIMSVTSTAIIGSAPANRSGMASAVEEVSFEFGSLLAVALMGSLLSGFYQRFAGTAPLQSGIAIDRAAYDAAYISTLITAVVLAVIASVITAILLKGNPKETAFAHE